MNIYKFPFKVDVSELKKEIEKNENFWTFDKSRQKIYEQKDTETIPLVNSRMRMGQKFCNNHEIFSTPLLNYFPSVVNFITYFIKTYQGECGRVAIVRLKPAAGVVKHIDFGEYYRLRQRFHLVVSGSYEYHVEDEYDIFSEGDLFWFNSQKIHWSKNIGTEDRVVLIFDIRNPIFMEEENV